MNEETNRAEEPVNIVVKGKKANTGEKPVVEETEETQNLEMNPEPVKVKLRDLIEQHLVATMTSNLKTESRRDRGKGRTGNGGHPSLLNLHRDMGHTKDLKWIDE